MLEGATFVCAGDGEEALDAVLPLQGMVLGGEVAWTMARAYLLIGYPDEAREHLKQVLASDTLLKARAEVLLLRIAEVEAQ